MASQYQNKTVARMLLLAGAAFASCGAAGIPDTAIVTPASAETVVVVPVEAPAALWTVQAAQELEQAIRGAAVQGLRPGDYRLAALRTAIARGPGAELDAVAQSSALSLAHDYRFGRVTDQADPDWHIDRPADDGGTLAGVQAALSSGRVGAYLASLLPNDERYVALREALAEASDSAQRDVIRANMERWRWMPRGMGKDYLYVNVPSYRLLVVDGGAVASSYTVVVGAPGTPTPWIAGAAPSLVVNPAWNVPQSIIRSSNLRPGRGGYIFKASAGGGWSVQQPPGPRNALGKLKINVMNDQAIYLHDTPSKAGFAKDERALSHGCIRVKDIDQLASELMTRGGDGAGLDEALAGTRTATLRLPKTWQVYLVYFTMDRDENGALVRYSDPYGRDAKLLAKLDGSQRLDGATMQVASN